MGFIYRELSLRYIFPIGMWVHDQSLFGLARQAEAKTPLRHKVNAGICGNLVNSSAFKAK